MIKVTLPLDGMSVSGYITSTNTEEGVIFYGVFNTLDEAQVWAKNLANATIEPIYIPAFNRG
jgi:hypothetical protein